MTCSKTVIVAMAALLSPLALQTARADEPSAEQADRNAELFDKLDADKNGQITGDEVGEQQRRLFERLLRTADQDADGKLTRGEFLAGLKGKPRRRELPEPEAGRPGERRFQPERLLERFGQMDKNGDGSIQMDELPEGRVRQLFSRLIEHFDADGNQALSRDEMQQGLQAAAKRFGRGNKGRPEGKGRPGRPGRGPAADRPHGEPGALLMRSLDTDHDGTLSSAEIAAAPQVLAQLDKDGDGRLAPHELMAHHPPADGRPAAAGKGERPRKANRLRGGKAGRRPDPEKIVQRLMEFDANGDGKLTADELPDRLRERFDRMDANGDGQVDEAELRARLASLAKRRGPRDGAPPRQPPGDKPL